MGQLRNRIRVIVARVRAGEGAHVLADLAETTEHWLKSGSLPQPLRSPAERLGTAVGDLGRAYRPPPSDIAPPEEARDEAEAMPRTARAHEEAPSNGHSKRKASKPRAKPEAPKRASARRSTTKKRAETSAPAAPEPKPQRKATNGKGRTKRPSARRASDKTPKPT